jgi:hypothetical protein
MTTSSAHPTLKGRGHCRDENQREEKRTRRDDEIFSKAGAD